MRSVFEPGAVVLREHEGLQPCNILAHLCFTEAVAIEPESKSDSPVSAASPLLARMAASLAFDARPFGLLLVGDDVRVELESQTFPCLDVDQRALGRDAAEDRRAEKAREL